MLLILMLAFMLANPNPSIDVTRLVDYGVLGLVVVGFLSGQIVSGMMWKRERDRADALEEKLTSFLPVAGDMAKATQEVLVYLRSRQR